MAEITQPKVTDPRVDELFQAGVHFGYARARRHPRMREFVSGVKSNIEIFNGEKIVEQLDKSLQFIESLGKEGGSILWVGTKPAAQKSVEAVALSLGHPFVTWRWVGGVLTNSKIIRERLGYWRDLVDRKEKGELSKYTKQEQLLIQRKIDRLNRTFHGLESFNSHPKALFVVDIDEEKIACAEAKTTKIPIIALLNTDCDPESVEYPIPGNDNAPRSVDYILEKAKAAYLSGKENGTN